MEDGENVGFNVRELRPEILEKVSLMNNSTLELFRSILEKIKITQFMTSQAVGGDPKDRRFQKPWT